MTLNDTAIPCKTGAAAIVSKLDDTVALNSTTDRAISRSIKPVVVVDFLVKPAGPIATDVHKEQQAGDDRGAAEVTNSKAIVALKGAGDRVAAGVAKPTADRATNAKPVGDRDSAVVDLVEKPVGEVHKKDHRTGKQAVT